MVGGKAVLEAVRTPGVLRHVAPHRADLLAGRVGREVPALRRRCPRHVKVDHARLDDGSLVGGIHLQDAAHPRGDDQYTLRVRQRAAGQASTRSASDERDLLLGAGPDHCRDLLGGFRQYY
jgi:hypothetical protein